MSMIGTVSERSSGWGASVKRLNAEPAARAWSIQDTALSMRAQNDDVIFLTVGDPDFETPAAIKTKAAEYLAANRTKYSPVLGEPALREAIAKRESARFGMSISANQVVVFPGAQNALFNLIYALGGPASDVMVCEPYYATYPGVISASGSSQVSLALSVEDDFSLTPDAFRNSITPATRVALLNSPGNPTGAVLKAETIEQIARICTERGIWLIADEVYCDFSYDAPFASFGEHFRDDESARLIVVNSISKSHAMTGWRIGWAVMPSSLSEALEALLSAQLFGVPQFLQDTVAWALQQDLAITADMRREYRKRRDLLVKELGSLPGFSCSVPAGGMFMMLKVADHFEGGEQFAQLLLKHAHVAVVPGFGFGEMAKDFVRISLTQPTDTLAEACVRIKSFVAAWQPQDHAVHAS